MNIFKRIERWFRKNILNPAKKSVAAELKGRLTDIDAAVQKAVMVYAASVGGEPLAAFLGVALQGLGLSDAASKWVQGLIDGLGAGASRSVQPATPQGRAHAAGKDAEKLLAAIREEANKA